MNFIKREAVKGRNKTEFAYTESQEKEISTDVCLLLKSKGFRVETRTDYPPGGSSELESLKNWLYIEVSW